MLRFSAGLGLVLTFALGFAPTHARAACPLPAEYLHQGSVTDGDVLVRLATIKDTFLQGEPVPFHLSFENTGTDTVALSSNYTPGYRIVILPDSCFTMYQPDCDTTWAHLPVGMFFFGTTIHVLPGECYIVEATWDDTSSLFPWEPGGYRALGGMPGISEDFSVPPGGAELLFTIDTQSTVTAEPITWGRLKDRYD